MYRSRQRGKNNQRGLDQRNLKSIFRSLSELIKITGIKMGKFEIKYIYDTVMGFKQSDHIRQWLGLMENEDEEMLLRQIKADLISYLEKCNIVFWG
jgi:hypothetical protein